MKRFISILAICIIMISINIVVSTFLREQVGYDNGTVIWVINFVIDFIIWGFFDYITSDKESK